MKISFTTIKNLFLMVVFAVFVFNSLFFQTETLSSGAFIINMGVMQQNVGNDLKPLFLKKYHPHAKGFFYK